jgi:citrate synthase
MTTTSTESSTDLDDVLIDVPPGLKGVAVAETSIGDVKGRRGFYHYRQYSATDLAASRSFEDVWQLVMDGSLPLDGAGRAAWDAEVKPQRAVPETLTPLLEGVAATSGPTLNGLRSAVSLLAGADRMQPIWDLSPAEIRADLLRLAATTPALVATLWRRSQGLDPIAPDPSLGHVANYCGCSAVASPIRSWPGRWSSTSSSPWTTGGTPRPSRPG